jgi:hypothetical protein
VVAPILAHDERQAKLDLACYVALLSNAPPFASGCGRHSADWR